MQLIPAHQIVDILPGTFQDAASFGCADQAGLNILMKILLRKRNGDTMRIQFAVRNHGPVIPVHSVSVRLDFHRIESEYSYGAERGVA